MHCETVIAQLVDALVDGQVVAPDASGHLATCPECEEDARTLRAVWHQASSIRVPSPSEAARLRCAQAVAAALTVARAEDGRTVSTLSRQRRLPMLAGFIGRRAAGLVAACAAAVAAVAVGVTIGRTSQRAPGATEPRQVTAVSPDASSERRFLLLLRRGKDVSGELPEADRRRVVDEYRAWAGRLAQEGRLVMADELGSDPGRVVAPAGAPREAALIDDQDSPRRLEGYFIITAPNYDAATAIANGCPHLKYGGTIELREIRQGAHS